MFNIYITDHTVNSLASSTRIILTGLSRNCALSQITCASNLANFRLQDDNKHVYDHLVDASIKIIKHLKSPHGGWISSHVSL